MEYGQGCNLNYTDEEDPTNLSYVPTNVPTSLQINSHTQTSHTAVLLTVFPRAVMTTDNCTTTTTLNGICTRSALTHKH